MQSHQQFYPPKAVPTFADQVEDNYMHIPVHPLLRDSDSHSAYGSKPRKNSSCSSTLKSSGSGGFSDPEKRLKMKKMVKVLRGIVPGADEMGTVAVLDEAVRYLKSLKVEAKKLGVESFKN
ncbi:hypothetical protein GQ457_03G035650 [Hibiscus cannabinus]